MFWGEARPSWRRPASREVKLPGLMNPERWQQVQEVLAESLDRTAEERDAFLSERCGDDVELRLEVESLLEASDRADGYFDELGQRAGIPRDATGDNEAEPSGAAARHRIDPDDSLIGRSVSHFRVNDFLGRGGMGKVYRATDSELHRDVALKVLSDELAGNPAQAARLKLEAQSLAALNHPNIAAIYGLVKVDGHQALVLELVEGETLAKRLASPRRPKISVEEALEIARQVAAALEAAHEKGIVHRDLKPANVALTEDNVAKVLDFGIAKALQPETDVDGDPEWSPTDAIAATAPGRIMGTAAYMSPEQARGRPVDGRTDVWAFGCVLYEMLAGKKAFPGDTVSDTIAAIIEREPDWGALPAAVPPEIRALLRRCLQKSVKRRLRNMGDAWLEIDEWLTLPASERRAAVVATTRPSAGRRVLPWAFAGLVGVAGLVAGWNLTPEAPEPTRRLEVALPGSNLASPLGGRALALSPDGRTLVHTSASQLYLRPLDRFESVPVPETLGAESPFFSPDGEWIGYFARGRLWKVSVRGGSPFRLCEATTPRGADWADDDRIVFSDGTSLWLVDSNGLECVQLAAPDTEAGEIRYEWPSLLPGGDHAIFELVGEGRSRLSLLSLADGSVETIYDGGSDAHYLPTGHIVFSRAGTLFALPFDAGRLRVTGDPRPVLDGVRSESTGAAHVAFSADGSLAYAPTPDPLHQLVWVDGSGAAHPISATLGEYATPRLSPDGTRVALAIRRDGEIHIWVHDIERDTQSRVTHEASNNWPDWTPDSQRLVFSSGRRGPSSIWWKQASGAGEARQLSNTAGVQYAVSVADRLAVAAFFQVDSGGTRDIWILPLDGEATARPLIVGPAHEQGPALSPDGRWIAYVSNESGRSEVYVQPCAPCVGDDEPLVPAGAEGRRQVSTQGGGEPVWHPNDTELFYRNGDRMMSVTFDDEFLPSRPALLFEGSYARGQSGNRNYDIAPDGTRFLMLRGAGPDPLRPRINVVLNWLEELKAAFSTSQQRR